MFKFNYAQQKIKTRKKIIIRTITRRPTYFTGNKKNF